METGRLYELLIRYRAGECTDSEKEALEQWYAQYEREAEGLSAVPPEKLDTLLYGIERRINRRPRRRSVLRLAIPTAACIAAIVGAYFIVSTPAAQHDIVSPGAWQAELFVEHGPKIRLGAETVADAELGFDVNRNEKAGICYSATESGSEPDTTVFHTIVVPTGSEYGVTLSDGSEVRLNSGSSLRYPVAFGDQRRVTLTGEAFFTVSTTGTPFVVEAPGMEVTVLGTSFNLCAYEEDRMVETTLVSGAVSVKAGGDYRLEPGQMLSLDRSTGQVSRREVDTSVSTSWVDGEFKFRDMRLEDIMNKLGRWYDCQTVFSDPSLKELRFSGAAEKGRPISYVLGMIEFVTDVDFDIKGLRITVRTK